MFERIRVDTVEQTGVPVELTLNDGSLLKGRFLIASGRNLFEVLNSAGGFIEFEQYGGERVYIAKATIANLKLVNVPKPFSLSARQRDLDAFDPHGILGVAPSTPFDEIKTAWHKLSKIYHPDRYSSVELPAEVRDYLATMARRINAAYAALESGHQSAKRAAESRAAPVYTSSARA